MATESEAADAVGLSVGCVRISGALRLCAGRGDDITS